MDQNKKDKPRIIEPDSMWKIRRDLIAVQKKQDLQWLAMLALGGIVGFQAYCIWAAAGQSDASSTERASGASAA